MLQSSESAPVARQLSLCVGKKPAGVLLETIGTVSNPRFVAQLEGNWPIGTEFDVCKK